MSYVRFVKMLLDHEKLYIVKVLFSVQVQISVL